MSNAKEEAKEITRDLAAPTSIVGASALVGYSPELIRASKYMSGIQEPFLQAGLALSLAASASVLGIAGETLVEDDIRKVAEKKGIDFDEFTHKEKKKIIEGTKHFYKGLKETIGEEEKRAKKKLKELV